MAFKLNKNDAGFKVLPEGTYEVYPVAYAEEVAKTSGNKMAQFNYIIRDDVDQEGQGTMIRFDNFVETEAAMWRVNQASDAAGIDMDAEFESIYEWAAEFVNKAIRIEVGQRTYDGKTFPEVKFFLPSMYGGIYVPSVEEESKKPLSKTTEATGLDISDDDLPF